MSLARRRQSIGRLWQRAIVQRSVTQAIVTGALVYIFDAIDSALDTSAFWTGPIDWIAHIGTALLILNLLPERWRRPILLPALLGSFLIDLDHLPLILGTDVLTQGTPRPYTHSLTTPVVLGVVGLALIALHRRRLGIFLIGFGFGTILHFLRDLAESPGVGIPMLWPLTKRAYAYPHRIYLVLIGVLIGLNLLRLAWERRGPSARSGRAVQLAQ